ncbi:sensor of ECF-type sigma factor [Lutibacter holmesii]|uniref:Sensor of ECF-type sigma factor n=1 Tax=Lutibacter holmesii TaxID=1137985 RepID=A0ABW3WJI5_9FLAO
MKKTIYTLLFLLITISVFSQHKNREKIKSLKTSFITEALSLTPSEAEKFWPIYNLYNNKIKDDKMKLEFTLFRDLKNKGGIDVISNEEANELIAEATQLEKNISDNKIKMTQELSKVLPPKKIIKLYKAEKDFNRRILQEYGRRKKMQGQ